MRINTNLTAMNTYTQYTKNNSKISSAVAKLSSGYSINSAADNAAGLAISEKMRAQIRGLNQASTNSQDAISLTQTAEGALSSSTEILQRMREISVQSSNDTNNTKVDREALQDEFSQLQNELNDISSTTSFNKKNLLDGSLAKNTATLSNIKLAKSGLSVDLGKVSAGNYAFSVGVKQESAAVTGVKSTFTVSSNNSAFTVGTEGIKAKDGAASNAPGDGDINADEVGSVKNNLGASALANGNYTITAKYDTDNKKMTFTAAGDNGQTFTATLTQSQLTDGIGGSTSKMMTLNFKNADSSTSAFTFNLKTTDAYDTTSDNTMTNLATQLTSALSLSASKGVDAQDATYGLYAKMTGADDVKLQAGMDSVSFDNGVKVSFSKLTTTDVDTKNAATAGAIAVSSTAIGTPTNTAAGDVKFSNFKATDNSTIANGTLTYTFATDGTITATDSAKNVYTAKTDATNGLSGTATAANEAMNLGTLSFADAEGNTAFTTDVTAKATAAGSVNVKFSTADTTGVTATVAGSAHSSDAIFGDLGKQSTFNVENKKGAGLTFQVGANEGDELVINVDKLDANYLGVASASVSTRDSASKAITSVDNAINQVSSQRAYLGAIQNRLNYKISNLNTSSQNLTAAESQIRDVDMAKEMTEFTNANILSQAATSMLAQANSLPQNVLSLLK